MKTNEELQSLIFANFENYCKAVNNTKNEFVKAQINDCYSDLSKLAVAKRAAAENYRKAENAYLLQTSIGETQNIILLQAIATFASEKEDKGFLLWIRDNNIIESTNELVTDTPTRLLSWLNNNFTSYIKGKKETINKKKEQEKEKRETDEAIEKLKENGLSLDDIIEKFGE